MIPTITPITVEPRPLNARLWHLAEREIAGKLTASERVELDCLFDVLEAEQDLVPEKAEQ